MVPIGEPGHHLRPIDPDDTELDMIARDGLSRTSVVDLRRSMGLAAEDDDS